jgi:phenylacetyl-CoA:acceptor oxidoreductase subunit 1
LTQLENVAKKLRTYQVGVALKCTFCVERVDRGPNKGLKPGIDREATPACVIACPTKTRVFGDLDNPDSEVSQLVREKRATAFHDEHGTGPSIYYIIR